MHTEELSPALLERARAGDKEAMEALYEATSRELYRSIRSMVRDEELALDIQQESYLQAFSHLEQLREPGRFLPWLRSIARNEARMQLRKRRPVLFTELSPEEGEAWEPELPDPSPEACPELSLDRKETARLLREILEELTEGQRLVVGLYYYENQSMEQIARDLNLSPGTVKAQLYRSRRKIESAVRRLEAKGVKLYGLGPLPFLLALLRRLEPPEQAKRRALAGILSGAGDAAATALGESALSASAVTLGQAGAVGLQVGRGFFQTVGGKLLLGGLTALALGGGVAGYRAYTKARTPPPGDWQPELTVEREIPPLIYASPEDLPVHSTTEERELLPETEAPSSPATDAAEQPAGPGITPTDRTPEAPRETAASPQPTQTEPVPPLTEDTEARETEAVQPEPTEERNAPTLPTTSPYPDSPGPQTISLGQSWTWTGTLPSDKISYHFTAWLLRNSGDYSTEPEQVYDLGSFYNGGVFQLSFTPTRAGTFSIRISIGVAEISWAQVVVTE